MAVRLPATYASTHDTDGLPGFPAIDNFGKAGTPVLAPTSGTLVDVHMIPWDQKKRVGGMTAYLQADDGNTYFLTHLGGNVKPGRVQAGQPIGVVGAVPGGWWQPHVHEGFHEGTYTPGVTPPPAQPTSFVQIAAQAAKAAGLDPSLFVAQIHQESGFNPNAVSPAGAKGIAQIVPGFHPDAPPASDPVGQLQWAANYMAGLVKKYGAYEPALSVYNSGKPNTYLDPGFAKGQTYNYVRNITAYAKNNPVAGSTASAPPASQPVSAPPAAVGAPAVAPKATPSQTGDQTAAVLAALSQRVQPFTPIPLRVTPAPVPLQPVAPTVATALPKTSFVPDAPLPPAPVLGEASPSFGLRVALLKGRP